MTVRELIQELIRYDMDSEVRISDEALRANIDIVKVESNRDEEEITIGIDISPNELDFEALGLSRDLNY